MKTKLQILTAAIALCSPMAISAAPKTAPSPSPDAHASASPKAPATEKTARAIPFHGTVSSVDRSAKTFTIAGKEKSRVFKITDKTVITKSGAAATMTDIAANESVSGSYWKAADGSLEAKTVKLGPKEETTKKKSSKAEASPSPKP